MLFPGVNSITICCRASRVALASDMRWPASASWCHRASRSLDTAARSSAVLASSASTSGSRPVVSGSARAERSRTPHWTSCTFWHHSARFTCLPRRHRNLLKNHWNTSLENCPSEMLLTHQSAAFGSPPQHEPASPAGALTRVWPIHHCASCRETVICGVSNSGPLDSGTIACTVPLSVWMYCITESMFFSLCLLSVPSTKGLWHSHVPHGVVSLLPMLFLVFSTCWSLQLGSSFVSSRDLSQLHQRLSPRDLLDDLALLHLHGVDDVLVLLRMNVDEPLYSNRSSGSCLPGHPSRSC